MPRKASPLSSTSIDNLLGAIFLFTTWYVFCLERLVWFESLIFFFLIFNKHPCCTHLFWRAKLCYACSYASLKFLEQTTNYSERYKWKSMSSRIIMQLCEDSLTFKNFRSWYFIQTSSKAKENGIYEWQTSCEEAKT